MPRPRSFNEQQVLESIRDVFWERGYASTSYEDLEKASGLKRTSLYAAFGNKEALFQRVLREYQSLAAGQLDRYFVSTDPLQGIKDLLTSALDNALADPDRRGCFINNVTSERGSQCPNSGAFILDNRAGMVQRFREQIEKAQSQGKLPTQNALALGNYLFTLYSGMMQMVKAGSNRTELEASLKVGLRVLEE